MKCKIFTISITALILSLVFCIYRLLTAFPNPHVSPDSIVFANPSRAVIDARQIINNLGSDTDRDGHRISISELPESLNVPNLKGAFVFNDHLSLIIGNSPDWNVGARIWAIDTNRVHEDSPLKYKDIFFYKYCNDYHESPTNIE